MQKILDASFEPVKFSIEESSDVDGTHILAKIRGRFFVPDGKSRNKRYYPASLWERVIADSRIQQKLKSRTMYGTISHEQPIDDKALLDGKISHIVTYLDSKTGIGEALVLNTPAGRILNTLARAGCQLYVSSRGYGKYAGKTSDGLDIVDESSYKLDTFDFVIEAGFLQANPQLVESYNQILAENCDDEGDDKDLAFLTVTEQLEELQEQYEEIEKELIEYKRLGTLSEVKKLISVCEDLLKSKTNKNEAFEHARCDLEKKIQKLESEKEQLLQQIECYEKDLSKVEHKVSGLVLLYKQKQEKLEEKYMRLKQHLEKSLNENKKLKTEFSDLKKKQRIQELSEKFRVPSEIVENVGDENVLKDISEFSKSLKFSERYKKGEPIQIDYADFAENYNKPLVDRLIGSF